jgi:hypothetical protein
MAISMTECLELCEDQDAAELLHAILNGERDPREVDSCDSWVRQCYHEPSLVEQQLEAANGLMNCHGVEAILSEGSWGECLMSYVNTGDTYAPTLVFDAEEHDFMVTSWGDWVEAYEREHGELP